jgi:hypothetical protein
MACLQRKSRISRLSDSQACSFAKGVMAHGDLCVDRYCGNARFQVIVPFAWARHIAGYIGILRAMKSQNKVLPARAVLTGIKAFGAKRIGNESLAFEVHPSGSAVMGVQGRNNGDGSACVVAAEACDKKSALGLVVIRAA